MSQPLPPPPSLVAIHGAEIAAQIAASKVLVVGAGGIGCELLKNLVLSGFTNLVILDLDTIEVSNLNRQFLFRKHHVGSPKAIIAREAALKFNPRANIEAYQLNIKDPLFSVEYVSQFQLVFSALDNWDARNYLNILCFRSQVPLLESGTRGYGGQAYSVLHGLTACPSCPTQPEQVTFAVCTIRNTPEKPEHCVTWAKHIYAALFGEPDVGESHTYTIPYDTLDSLHKSTSDINNNDDKATMLDGDGNATSSNAADIGENGQVEDRNAIDPYDLQTLESSLNFLKSIPQSTQLQKTLYKVFQTVYYYFTYDLVAQRCYKSRWAARQAPTPLPLPLPQYIAQSCTTATAVPQPTSVAPSVSFGNTNDPTYYTHDIAMEKQHIAQPIGFYLNQFITATYDLFTRKDDIVNQYGNDCKQQYIDFDKDDQFAMAFVTAAANLRMYTHHIPLSSEFDIKGIAGNIIHAIATTNAIVGGLMVSHAIQLFKNPQFVNYLHHNVAMTQEQYKQLTLSTRNNISFNWVNTAGKFITALTPEPQEMRCWCIKGLVLAHLSPSSTLSQSSSQSSTLINPFQNITAHQFLSIIEGVIGGVIYYQRIKNKHDGIEQLLEESSNIEDFSMDPLDHQNILHLGDRGDGIYYKLKVPQQFAENATFVEEEEYDDDMSDDEEENECENPTIYQSLNFFKVSNGSILKLYQLEQGLNFLIRCVADGMNSNEVEPQLNEKYQLYIDLIKAMFATNKTLKDVIANIDVFASPHDFTEQNPTQSIKVVITLNTGIDLTLVFNQSKLIEMIPKWLKYQKAIKDAEEAAYIKMKETRGPRVNQFKGPQSNKTTFSIDGDDVDVVAEDEVKKVKHNEPTSLSLDHINIDTNEMVSIGAPTTQVPAIVKLSMNDCVELD